MGINVKFRSTQFISLCAKIEPWNNISINNHYFYPYLIEICIRSLLLLVQIIHYFRCYKTFRK